MRDQRRIPTILVPILLLTGSTACASEPPPDLPPSATQSPGTASPIDMDYRAGGNEPFWDVVMTEDSMLFTLLGGDTLRASRPEPEMRDGGWHFDATDRDRPLAIRIVEQRCNDTMSGRPFPHVVEVYADGTTYAGCGGDTATLLTDGSWRVTELGGAPVLPSDPPTLEFAADGALTGNGGCNRYRSTYEITGEGLLIGPALATRMACADPEMNTQEVNFFARLEEITRFDLDHEDRLVLFVLDQPAIVAEPVPDDPANPPA